MNGVSSFFFMLQPEPWMDRGACLDEDPSLFFPERGQSKRPGERICQRCPVQSLCAEYAERTHTEYGIWGGELRNPQKLARASTQRQLAS